MIVPRFAIVTGAASGIGHATVKQLVKQGWIVGALDRYRVDVLTATNGLESAVIPLVADVRDFLSVQKEVENFMREVKATRLDLLVNSAGLLYTGHFEDQPVERIDRLLAVNNAGIAHCCLAVLPWLQSSAQAGGRPVIVNLSSASSVVGIPSMAVYSASKFWVRGFTEALSVEWSRFGIAVRDVMPPFVKTPMLDGRMENSLVKALGVGLIADDVAWAILKAVDGGPLHRFITLKLRLAYALVWIVPGRIVRNILAVISNYPTRASKC